MDKLIIIELFEHLGSFFSMWSSIDITRWLGERDKIVRGREKGEIICP